MSSGHKLAQRKAQEGQVAVAPWAVLLVIAGMCPMGGCDDPAQGMAPATHGDGVGEHPPGEHAPGTEHEGHDGPSVSITRWTEELELYAEHPPGVVGTPIPFLAHLTALEAFDPVTDATVTLELRGPAILKNRVDTAVAPGIFRPQVTPTSAGTYEARLVVRSPRITDDIEGFEIRVYETAEQAAAAVQDDGDAPNRISFLKEQQWQVPFATAFAERRPVVPTIEVAGEVTTPPAGSAEVGAPIAGRVVAAPSGLPRPGDPVTAGQVLATIAPAPSSAEGAAEASLVVAEAEARAAAARSALARAERLFADQAVSERELEDARREASVAEEAVRAANRARQLFSGAASGHGAGTFRLASPIDGVLAEVSASPGRSVEAGTVLFRVVDLRELWIRARVPEQDATRLRTDADASLGMGGLEERIPLRLTGDSPTATIISVSRVVDPVSRTVDVLYGLSDPDPRLRIGGLVRLSLPVGDRSEGVAVPREAIVDDDGRSVVYVQVEGEAFEERPVQLGPTGDRYVAVTRGVEEGERVVTRGGNLIRIAARATSSAGHGHVH